MPTTAISDLAKLAVVSISTVSRMCNGRNRVHPQTRPRIQKAIRQLDYEQIAPAHTLVEHLLSGHDYRRFARIAGSNDTRDNAERLHTLAVCASPKISHLVVRRSCDCAWRSRSASAGRLFRL